MVTIYDVARYVGVSKSTVSAVLNKNPNVKEETRLRVEAAFKELGYVANQNARGLAKRETKSIGIVSAVDTRLARSYEAKNENGQFVFAVSNGIIDRLSGSEYSVVTERYNMPDAEGEVPQIVKSARVDGVILVGGLFNREIIDKILAYGVPVVGIYVDCDGIDTISPDISAGTYLATDELLQNGCRNIVLLNAPEAYSTAESRSQGWQRALAKYPGEVVQHTEIHVSTLTGGGGYLAMKTLWEQGIRPDGITTAVEAIALGAMQFLAEQGVRIPQDISVTVLGTSDLSVYAVPPITSVDVHEEDVGSMAAEMLLKRIRKPDAPIEKRVIGVTLQRRASVRYEK